MRISDVKPFKVILESETEYSELEDENFGLCLNCGADHYSCEPDAERYLCDDCGEKRVYGLANLLMNNRIIFLPEV